ncbi:MAG TPA: helix-turn-helix domain-containing protein [Streptosporangiaceae bacterium]|nr:helix-turn-helix domain-containing protein [Streptosporangiaceae bacterium]
MLSSVAVLAYDGVSTFGLGVTAEIFGCDRSADGLPGYDYTITAAVPGVIRTDVGLPIMVEAGLDRLSAADLGIVVCWDQTGVLPPPAVLEALRALAGRGGRVLSQCTGAFVLAAAGLLDGRRATTHWRHAAKLASRYPSIDVDPSVLYVDDGQVITSAGTAAGIDACLHLLRLEHGAAVANAVARHMVVPPHRDGGQAQYVPVLVNEAGDPANLAALHAWTLEHLHEPITVADLAARALMSPRTFARQFAARTGTTPHQWLISQRLMRAQELLEHAGGSIEQIAAQCGLTPLMLRRHFARRCGTTPQAYRRTFSQSG